MHVLFGSPLSLGGGGALGPGPAGLLDKMALCLMCGRLTALWLRQVAWRGCGPSIDCMRSI